METIQEAEEHLTGEGFEYVRFEQPDLHGLSRGKTVPARHFRHYAEHGLNFLGGLLGLDAQGGVASGTGYLEERNFADSLIFPDLSTLAPVPWAERTARVLADPQWYGGEPLLAAPRHLARVQVQRLADLGYDLRSGFEYECYFVHAGSRAPAFEGIQIFWTVRNNFDQSFVTWLLDSLQATGVDIITSNVEYGPGQMEINFAPRLGLAAPDQAFVFKSAVKELAQQRGYLASFMTKPYANQSASGCHYHHSLLHRDGGANAFADPDAADGLSLLARHWIAGQMAHARALAAVAAPTVNCAKRYKLFSFAPMNVTWGHEDRTAALRVKGARGAETHLENRIPCAGSNPYLVLAAVVAAGLDGVARKLEPPPPTTTVAYADQSSPKLPATLDAAVAAFEDDEVLGASLGEEFVHLFLAVKRHEIQKARSAIPEYARADWPNVVTDWERENLFEYL
ncbi:MAG TPA: glutamine synthetase family protein [Terriglobales bacterium]|nr:glutamine synthetase family protein [Terriglobales bacterium]